MDKNRIVLAKIHGLGAQKLMYIIITVAVLITNLTILLNISFLRPIFGFLFLTILPGLSILQILKLNKIGYTEKVVLSVGISISFLMFFGLFINNLSLNLGYKTPLLTIPLLISFNLAFVVFGIIGYKIDKTPIFSLPNVNLSTSEKAFLIVPVMFPALSIFGMHLMNTTDNNIILMFLYLLIPAYVIFVCFFNQKFPKRLHPVVIFLISLSLLLIYMLRFPHIHGRDVHTEYYLFQTTLNNLHWSIVLPSTLDACLSISLLPTIYQSIMNVDAQEYLFKGVYVSICSFSPLAIYVMSKRYIGKSYAFLASFFFISQGAFLTTARNPRTDLAIFFAALAVMVFFNDKIDPLKRRFLFIIFIFSVVVSHYSTAYLFFFMILFTWFAVEIFSKKCTLNKNITLTGVLLFFAFIFFWYSQITEVPFNAGVKYFENTFLSLNKFFLEESRDPGYGQLVGRELKYGIISRINFFVTWGSFILIGIGVLTMVKRYKEMVSISNIKVKKPDFLKTKFEVEFLTMVLACAGILVLTVALPYVSTGYGVDRLYSLVVIILSVCFVIGGITLSKHLKVWTYLVILLILIPYFLMVTGVTHQIAGMPASIVLNSVGESYEREYLHDQESCSAKWLKNYAEKSDGVYTDRFGLHKLISQGDFSPYSIDSTSFPEHRKIKGYLYLNYNNVVNGNVTKQDRIKEYITVNISNYTNIFVGKNKIYANGGSEVYK